MNPLSINNITILDPGSEWHRKKVSLQLLDGAVTSISESNSTSGGGEAYDGEGQYLSRGWTDMRAGFCDPGYEYKEDLESGLEAAAAGGFTGVALLPETQPVIANKALIEYVLRKSASHAVQIYPLAALTTDKEQENLVEMFDARQAGAVGFSSGYKPVYDSGFLLRAMEYAAMTGLPLMVRAENKGIAGKGTVNEGHVSVSLGLKGIPHIAEISDINNIISLVRYTGQPVHISCVSTKEGMQLIEQAVAGGLKITADVCIHNLYFTDEDLGMFNTNLKLRPPVRTDEDRSYLREAVLKNSFVCVVSDHTPHEEDKKHCEFELASYGAIGLQTVFSQMLAIYGEERLDDIVEILSTRPAGILNLSKTAIGKDCSGSFTVFSTDTAWTLDESTSKSKSTNSPLWGKTLKGRATAVYNNNQLKILL